jgi:hypothetical protein
MDDIPVFVWELRRVVRFLHDPAQLFILFYFKVEEMSEQFGLSKKVSVTL